MTNSLNIKNEIKKIEEPELSWEEWIDLLFFPLNQDDKAEVIS